MIWKSNAEKKCKFSCADRIIYKRRAWLQDPMCHISVQETETTKHLLMDSGFMVQGF
jgi:hypothetical protein